MNKNQSKIDRLMLARLLKLYTEVNTEEGILISEDELIIGAEVFQVDEDGNLIPATDGEYHTDEAIYTVVSGQITSIEKKEIENDPEPEPEHIENENEPEPEPEANEEVDQLKAELDQLKAEKEELQGQVDQLKAEKEELQGQVDQLKAENDELKAKIEELNKQLEEPMAPSVDEKEKDFNAQHREEKLNNVYNIVKNIKKNK